MKVCKDNFGQLTPEQLEKFRAGVAKLRITRECSKAFGISIELATTRTVLLVSDGYLLFHCRDDGSLIPEDEQTADQMLEQANAALAGMAAITMGPKSKRRLN